MTFFIAEKVLSAAVATSGTFTIDYPDGTDAGTFQGGSGHKMYAAGHQYEYTSPAGFTVSFDATTITITHLGATALPLGKRVTMQFNGVGASPVADPDMRGVKRVSAATPVLVSLGAPDTADPNGVSESQGATTMALDGALVAGGVATFDVPRNVVGAWTTTAVATITGTDEYGNVIVETSASGASHTGKKAFKTVTSVVMSTAVTGATFGTGVVLGLPFRLKRKGDAIAEIEDGVAATAGTLVVGIVIASTGTTGDVRGTYAANSTPNGSKAFALSILADVPSDLGNAQYAG